MARQDLSRSLSWSTRKPDKVGYWWHRCTFLDSYLDTILSVRETFEGSLYVGNCPVSAYDRKDQWAGPIPQPR